MLFRSATVLGNGRLGAMDFGGTQRQQIVLNESTMWSGGPYDADRPDAHRCLPDVRAALFAGDIGKAESLLNANFRYPDGVQGWHDRDQFGCYQVLGQLTLDYGGPAAPKVSSPSGHQRGDGKAIELATDGDVRTKWCVTNNKKPVVWQLELAEAVAVSGYRLASGDDMQERDPQAWTVEGYTDGAQWTLLDRHDDAPFAERGQWHSYAIAEPKPFRWYRCTFAPKGSEFQVAEIAFDGVTPTREAPGGYRRELDLMTGRASTSYQGAHGAITRELITSAPDGVLAIRIASTAPEGLSLTAALSRSEQAKAQAVEIGRAHV